mmetsp:Transcript_88473/g.245728  ORF Transcript_88473/g.245728 Transcript_88473/m.245728 type:complete len:486 (+) Transcript_88473:267-1724(+)
MPGSPFTIAYETTPLIHDEKPTLASRVAKSALLVVTSGAGLLADGYDIMVIDLVIADIAYVHPSAMGPKNKSFAASMTLLGVIFGQLSFGTIADVVGAKAASIVTALMIAVAALLSACCRQHEWLSLPTQLGLCRLLLGIGVGGEYPVSAALGVEGHSSMSGTCSSSAFWGSRPQLQTLIAGMFNLGSVFTAVVVLVLLWSGAPLEAVWRCALGLGALPALVALISRASLPPGVPGVGADDAGEIPARCGGYTDRFLKAVGPRRMLLLGACLSWAIFNITMYGQSSFRSIISDRIFGDSAILTHESVRSVLHRNAVFSLTMSLCACAGTVVGVCLVDKLWRFQLQLFGFFGTTSAMFVCGVLLGKLPPTVDWPLVLCNYLWVILYTQVSISTYLIPAECFPAMARATCFGIAAASGKFGALVGTSLFPICEAAFGLEAVMLASGCISFLGILVTLAFTPRVDVDPAKLDALPASGISTDERDGPP